MSKITKILVVCGLAFIFFANVCYGIDLNLTENTAVTDPNAATSNTATSNPATSATTNAAVTGNSVTSGTTSNTNSVANDLFTSNTSSTVSSVSNATNSNTSTITNLINIALIVIGVLLIFFAIAILIRISNS